MSPSVKNGAKIHKTPIFATKLGFYYGFLSGNFLQSALRLGDITIRGKILEELIFML